MILKSNNNTWIVSSTVIISLDKRTSYKITYNMELSSSWIVKKCQMEIEKNGSKTSLIVEHDKEKDWYINNNRQELFKSCTDLDLGFTPFTNTIPIHRLSLKIKESSTINALWVQFPSFEIKPFTQKYTRIGEKKYLYETLTGFKAELKTNEFNFVEDYSPYWKMLSYV